MHHNIIDAWYMQGLQDTASPVWVVREARAGLVEWQAHKRVQTKKQRYNKPKPRSQIQQQLDCFAGYSPAGLP
jgi:hypothetical protein